MEKLNLDMKKGIIVDDLVKTESSNVQAIAYLNEAEKAFVHFKNGKIYEYEDVELSEYESLRDAKSVGSHLARVFLKKGFEYKQLEPETFLITGAKLEELTLGEKNE